MNKYTFVLSVIVLLHILIPMGVAVAGDKERDRDSLLIDFEIEDQFKNKHSDEDFRGSVIFFISGDRKGNNFRKLWESEIRDSLGELVDYENLSILRAANLKGVPFFIKGKVRGSFSKNPEEWVLLDWKNRFKKAYDFGKNAANILIFDRDGKLVRPLDVKEIDHQIMNELLGEIRALTLQNKD